MVGAHRVGDVREPVRPQASGEARLDAADEAGPFVDEGRIELDQRGAGADLGVGVLSFAQVAGILFSGIGDRDMPAVALAPRGDRHENRGFAFVAVLKDEAGAEFRVGLRAATFFRVFFRGKAAADALLAEAKEGRDDIASGLQIRA